MRMLLDLLMPSRCAGCQRDGEVLCPGCAALLGPPQRVRLNRSLPPVYALGRYRGPLRRALLAYKERGWRELARPFGVALAGGTRLLPAAVAGAGGVWLVPVPSRWSAARRRGGDHMRRLANRAAQALAMGGVPAAVAPALRLTRGVRDSVGLDPAARVANLTGRIQPRLAGLPPPGVTVVILDDVTTTGTTAATCTAALADVGIQVRAVLVLASAAPLLQSGDLCCHSVTVCVHCRLARSMTA